MPSSEKVYWMQMVLNVCLTKHAPFKNRFFKQMVLGRISALQEELLLEPLFLRLNCLGDVSYHGKNLALQYVSWYRDILQYHKQGQCFLEDFSQLSREL